MSKIMNKLVGESEKRIDQAFRIVKACAPCVFLIDEVEKAMGGVRSSNSSDAGTTARCFGAMLQFMNEDNGVFMIMTSNDVSQLPPELTRSGRLDAMWYFSLPTPEERREIFRIHLGKTGKAISDELINAAVNASDDFTGAEIQQSTIAAVRKAYKRFLSDGNNAITEDDLVNAIHETIPIAKSSQEKIAMLENFAKGRARYANGVVDSEGFHHERDEKDLGDIELD
jgi:SpoVK/Ycf46/Vps4 family AAA+-type ATPase